MNHLRGKACPLCRGACAYPEAWAEYSWAVNHGYTRHTWWGSWARVWYRVLRFFGITWLMGYR